MQKTIVITVAVVIVVLLGIVLFLRKSVTLQTAPPPPLSTSTTSTPPGTVPPTASANIRVTAPQPNEAVGLPLVIRGEARTFESTVSWRLRDADGSELVSGFTTANAPDTGQFGPFEIRSSYPTPRGTTGTVEVFENSAKDGEEINMVRIPIRFAAAESMNVKVYFSNEKQDPNAMNCERTYSVTRRTAKTTATARAALDELLQGPYLNEWKEGYRTNINQGTVVQRLEIRNGTAYVDFNDTFRAGVAGSCRVSAIRSQIENTLKQFPTIKNVVISVNGTTEGVLEP